MTDGEINVLVCTTIIETGIDLPNVNTLIIEDADKMGLAQLHQIRGRVGRSNRRAFAYLTYRRGKVLSEVASKRLGAIREFGTRLWTGMESRPRVCSTWWMWPSFGPRLRRQASVTSARRRGDVSVTLTHLDFQQVSRVCASPQYKKNRLFLQPMPKNPLCVSI